MTKLVKKSPIYLFNIRLRACILTVNSIQMEQLIDQAFYINQL
jgi:hypothetical protein